MIKYPLCQLMLLIYMVSSIVACKKSSLTEEQGQPESPTTGTRQELTLDSVYLYFKHTYLWNDALPDYPGFYPRRYQTTASDLQNLKRELYDLSQYPVNTRTAKPYEHTTLPGLSKYSYLEAGSTVPIPGATARTAVLNTDTYNTLAATSGNIITAGLSLAAITSGNTAYLKLSRFAHLNELSTLLNNAFAGFAAASVNTLIVDLRDNPGGYVEAAEYLANLMASPAMTGKVMYSQHFNPKMQQGKVPILKNQPYLDENNRPVFLNGRMATYADVDYSIKGNTYLFKKEGQLKTLQKLYFLVNDKTASASELLINVLKPYFEVTLIGSKTYGKPLGSFAIKIDVYTLYAVSFQIRNGQGTGDYFDGMPPDLPANEEQLGGDPAIVLENTLQLVSSGRVKSIVQQARTPQRHIILQYSAGQSNFSRPEMIKENLKLKLPDQTKD